MDEHRTFRMRPETRAERRKAERRRRFIQHLLASFILAGTALALVLLFGQSEPPLMEATLPDKPTEEEDVHGFELGREQVLAPVAAERRSGGPQKPADGRTAPGGSGSTGAPPPSIPAGIPAPPVDQRARNHAPIPAAEPTPDDDIDDEPREQNGSPPPPVTTSPSEPPEEEAFRPPIDPIVDPVCWDGWTYDESRRECIREDELEPSGKNEEVAEEEQPEETTEPGVGNDLGGGIRKGAGSALGKDAEVTR